MLQKHYDKLISTFSESVIMISDILRKVSIEHITDYNVLSEIQDKIISLGNEIEGYNLKDSLIIKDLEAIAELIYSISQNDFAEGAFTRLNDFADALLPNLKDSVSINAIRLSLVLIIKNDTCYLTEWIEFHNMLGVDHFYIYDNESSEDILAVLKPYIDEGLVTYTFWPGRTAQISAYNHALKNYKYETEYMGFIDIDEFLFPVSGWSIPDTIDMILSTYKARHAKIFVAGGIGVNWRSYGTSYIKNYKNGLVIDNYRLRGPDDYEENVHIKTICKPDLVRSFMPNPHNVFYIDPVIATISEHGSMIPSAFFYDGRCELLRINHYYTKSEEELVNKMTKRGWLDVSDEMQAKYAESLSKRLTDCNDIEDNITDRFIEPLSMRLQKRR